VWFVKTNKITVFHMDKFHFRKMAEACGISNLQLDRFCSRPQLILCSNLADECRVQIHRECFTVSITAHEYVRMKKNNEEFGYVCSKCKNLPAKTVDIPVV